MKLKYRKVMTILIFILISGLFFYFKIALRSAPEPNSWNIGIVAPYRLDTQVLYMHYQTVDGKNYVTNKFFIGTGGSGYGDIDHWERVVISDNRNISPLPGLPKVISLCWYSDIEAQLYGTEIVLTPEVQKLMLEKFFPFVNVGKNNVRYRDQVMVGLAPGGVVNAWLNTPDKIDYPSIWIAEGKTKRAEETDWCKGSPPRTKPYSKTEEIKRTKKFPYGHWKPNEPNPLPHSKFFVVKDEDTGEPLAHIFYRITTDDGRVFEGATNRQGETREVFAESEDAIHFELLEEEQSKK